MGQKDIAEKRLEEYNEVFADIVNVLLFNGERRVAEDDLEVATTKTQYKAETDKLHEQERDVSKYWKSGKVKIALYGLENQTKIDRDMSLRIISYDGGSYRAQLLAKEHEIFPVISVVLYFGDKRWDNYRSLREVLDVPEGLEEYFNDYKINVFEISWLTDEQINLFQSDFKIVAEFFSKIRKDPDYRPELKHIDHVHEILSLLTVLTNDPRFEAVAADVEKKGDITMCDVLDRIEEKGIEKGFEKGIEKGIEKGFEKGIEKGRITLLFDMVKDEVISPEDAARRLGMQKEEFLKKGKEFSEEK